MKKRVVIFDINGYYKPTPVNIRKLGDAMLGASQFLTGYSVIMEERWLALACIAFGSIGKFITNFYTEIPSEQQIPNSNQA